jgi:hypothetical protein
MKKLYKQIKTLVVLLSLVALKAGAQSPLSGTVTINNTQAQSASNYTSFTALATVLNSVGISGPLVVNVAPNTGPYNEQPAFGNIPGVSSNNRIYINGNNCLLTFNATNSGLPYTMLLNGTKWMNISNVQMQGTNASYAMVCILTNGSDNNTFTSCTFSCPANGTSSYQIPFSFNSSTSLPTSGGNPGNNNTITSSTLSSGYYSIWHYGLTSSPWTFNNSFVGCYITDFYYYCVYGLYAKNFTMRGCTFDRLTRTTQSTYTYMFYGMYMQGLMFENNLIHKLYEANQLNSSSYLYAFYYTGYYNPVPGNRNIFRNNIVKDINFLGYIYMFMYSYYADIDYVHNTISLDQITANTTAQTYVFYYCYAGVNGANTLVNNFKNNIISITRGGTGAKYAMYMGSTTGMNIDYNDIYVNSAGGGNNIGYLSSTATTWSQWQAMGVDVNGYSLTPQFANLTTGDLHPTNVALDNKATPLGVMFDYTLAVRNPTTPDIGALEFLTPNCTGQPNGGLSGPSFSLCPGESASFMISPLSADAGITYQWNFSNTSQVGPFTAISNATSIAYTVPNVTATTWVQAVITCTNPGGSSTSPVMQVNISPTTTNSVPYFEGFENIGLPNRLPNCSWTSPNIGSTAFTYTGATTANRLPRNGSSFGAFANSTAGMSYYYTNQIWMEPNVTYSASVWFQTDFTGATNWTDMSILLATGQSTSAITSTIASTNGPAVSPVHKSLSNTFTVPAAAFYNVVIRATATSGAATYLSWDDLAITIPCTPSVNVVPITVAANNATVCSGTNVNLTASGANTYVWNTGNTGSNNTQSPIVNPTMYSVTGTNTLTGCSATASKLVYVKPTPQIVATAFPPVSCAGQPVSLSAGGANVYQWSNSTSGAVITVTPSSNNSYTVFGTNAVNCIGSAVVNVVVNPNPTISVTGPQQICIGETAVLIGSGAANFKFMANTAFIQANPASVSPVIPTTYTVVGTDVNNCSATYQYVLNVDACTGLSKNATSENIMVYPNPASDVVNVVLSSGAISSIQVVDVTGRLVLSSNGSGNTAAIDLQSLSNGVYYVKVSTGNSTDMIKVIKN